MRKSRRRRRSLVCEPHNNKQDDGAQLELDISNWFTLIGVVITVVAHAAFVSSKISKFMGTTEQCLVNLSQRIDGVEGNHHNCEMRRRITEVEKKQSDLRDEDMPKIKERLAKIEQDLLDIKRRLDEIKSDMREYHQRRDRRSGD